jgi:hypothetical protein
VERSGAERVREPRSRYCAGVRGTTGLIVLDSHLVFVISARRDNSRRPKVELCCESLVTDSSLRFQESTMAVAIRTGDKTAQTAGVCGRDPEIELKSASAVLAACSIHHALSAIASGVILLSYCIHPDFLLSGG